MKSLHIAVVLAGLLGAGSPALAQSFVAVEPASAPAPAEPLPAPPPAPDELIIRGGMLLDGLSDQPVPNRGIVMRGGLLMEVNVDLTGRDLSKAQVIDL